jgi:hypothetical protein
LLGTDPLAHGEAMSAAHTPGPWRYGEASNAIINPRGRLIASLHGRDSDGEELIAADAKLLAAAPQLAEALRDVLAFLDPDSIADQRSDARLREERAAAEARARTALAAAGVKP